MTIDFSESDIAPSIYTTNKELLKQKQEFESEVGKIYEANFKTNSIPKRNINQKSEEFQRIVKEHFPDSRNPTQGFILDLAEKLDQKLKEEFNCHQHSFSLQGLDNSNIDLNRLVHRNGGVMYGERTIKDITFLVAGFLNEDYETKETFRDLTKIDQSQNLFVNFRWESSNLQSILTPLISDIKKIYNKTEKKETLMLKLKEFLSNLLLSAVNSSIKKAIYYFVRAILWLLSFWFTVYAMAGIFILTAIVEAYFVFTFKETHNRAKQYGKTLANLIKKVQIHPVSVDLIGHSLGTVVISNTLSNLTLPLRYVICIGGVAIKEEIESLQQSFEMCFNYYSNNDSVLNNYLVKLNILGKGNYIGLNSLDIKNEQFVSQMIPLGHQEQMKQLASLFRNAIKKCQELKDKKRKLQEEKDELMKLDVKSKEGLIEIVVQAGTNVFLTFGLFFILIQGVKYLTQIQY